MDGGGQIPLGGEVQLRAKDRFPISPTAPPPSSLARRSSSQFSERSLIRHGWTP
jgi:hypothetical protein